MFTGSVLSYDDARRLARDNQWREKALVYVTRGTDLLVLEHTADYPDGWSGASGRRRTGRIAGSGRD